MRKKVAVLFAVLTVGLWFVPTLLQAQEGSKESAPAQPAKASPAEPVQAYRLDFSFNEVLDGKTVNTRHYSMNLTSGGSDEVKIGTRVPVTVGVSSGGNNSQRDTQFQYIDVGTNIWAQLRKHSDESVLVVRGEVSNLDTDAGDHSEAPVVRQIKISGETLLVAGKPIVIGAADDPNSKRQFQLEVTVTRLK